MIEKSVYEEAAAYIQRRTGGLKPDAAVVLGSGLGDLSRGLKELCTLPYSEIPGFSDSRTVGHAGNLVFCGLGKSVVAVMQGRYHYYEGRTHEEIVFPLRVLGLMGARTLIVTNASGGISEQFSPGDIMLIDDHIKFAPESPLRGDMPDMFSLKFVDMTQAYDPELKELALRCAAEVGLELKRGIYMYMTGPQFETPAEIRAIRTLGGDSVGMSTVPEVIAAAQMGMKALGLSLISNSAAGITGNKLSHAEVLQAGENAKVKFTALIVRILEELDNGNTL